MYTHTHRYISITKLSKNAYRGGPTAWTSGAQPTALARPGRPDPAWAPLPARLGRPGSTWLARFGFDGRPGRPRDTIFEDPGSAFGSIFVVFRSGLARATRLAGRRAEPLFLLAGAVLWRVRRLDEKSENRRRLATYRSDIASQTSCTRTTQSVRSRTRLGVDFGRLGVLPGGPGHSVWRPRPLLGTLRALPGRAEDAPRLSRDAPETPSGCSWAPRGVPRVSREQFWIDFGCPPGISQHPFSINLRSS